MLFNEKIKKIRKESNLTQEGLLEKHIDEVGSKLKLDNERRHFAEKKSQRSL